MKVLLDTHAFLWAILADKRLSKPATKYFETSELFLSPASLWEIVNKIQIGKLPFPDDPPRFLQRQIAINRITILPINASHSLKLYEFPLLHKDPFDRILAAQCIEEKLPLVSCDEVFDQYGVKRLW